LDLVAPYHSIGTDRGAKKLREIEGEHVVPKVRVLKMGGTWGMVTWVFGFCSGVGVPKKSVEKARFFCQSDG
jgi:hypothetical protein